MVSMTGFHKSEDWDPEYTPKSKTYYLVRMMNNQFNLSSDLFFHSCCVDTVYCSTQHDDRDKEAEYKWMANRGQGRGSTTHGRARFIIRKATAGSNTNGPTWGRDKFQINGEQGGTRGEVDKQDHKEKDTDGDNTWAVTSLIILIFFVRNLILSTN